MNATAKRTHALIHTQAVVWLFNNVKEYEWLLDLDIHVTYNDQARIIRPDIVGENKEGIREVFVEISDSTLSKDLNRKFDIYSYLGIPYYVVVNCRKKRVLQFKNIDKLYTEEQIFSGMEGLFKVGDYT